MSFYVRNIELEIVDNYSHSKEKKKWSSIQMTLHF